MYYLTQGKLQKAVLKLEVLECFLASMKMGFFKINCKAENDEKETVTVFNLLGTVIANREKFFKYLEQVDLQLLEKY